MKKKIFIILLNLVFIFIIVEGTCYLSYCKKYDYRPFHSPYCVKRLPFDSFFSFVKKDGFRPPVGLEYKKRPIVLFGCSFAWGWGLEEEQRFQYKLSQAMKRPVYNRAYKEWFGLAQLLYQSRTKDLYEEIKSPEYVIYVFFDDHIRRMLSCIMFPFQEYPHLRYRIYNGTLEKDKLDFLCNNLYSYQKISQLKLDYDMGHNHKKVFNLMREHFIEAKQEMDKHWKDYKFIIYIYNDDYQFSEEDINRLKNDGFIVVTTEELIGEPLDQPQYQISKTDLHPNEKAWDKLAPAFVEFLNKL